MFTSSFLDAHDADGGLDLDLDWGSQGVLGQKNRTIRLRICRLSDTEKSENLILSHGKRKSDLRIDREFFIKKNHSARRVDLLSPRGNPVALLTSKSSLTLLVKIEKK